jgi:hypothetical protein
MFRNHRISSFGIWRTFVGKAASGIRKSSASLFFGKFALLRRFTIHHSPFTSHDLAAVPDSPFTIHHSRPLSLFTSVSVLRPMLSALCSLRSGHSRPFTIHHSPLTASLVVAVAVLGLCFAVPAHATDKLIVQDATGTNTVFVVTDSPAVGIGTANPSSTLSVTDQTTTANRGYIGSQNSSDAASANLILRKSRGTEAAPTAVASGDYVGAFQFRSYSGTSYLRNAFVGARVDGTVTSTSVPTDIFFCNSATDESDCYGSGKVRMLISATGNVGIGTTTPTQKLDVNDTGLRIDQSMTPATSSDPCNQGQIAWDTNYVYVCVATNTWKRAALSSW